jgi:hypothetical protein
VISENSDSSLIVSSNYEVQLNEFEESLLKFIALHDLPTESILIPINERIRVLRNVQDAIALLKSDKKRRSIYISKFIAATASGLFDSALNYLWNETVSELRQRIADYDLPYFYDNAVTNPEKRKILSTAKDLEKIDDIELIQGAREIELISDLGFRHLNFIRDMRNHASAAHPNQNEITGLLLIGWLETCIREVISLPEPYMATKIKRLLARVKTNSIDDIAAEQIATTFDRLTAEQVNNLASGFFWYLYQTRYNVPNKGEYT